MMNEDKREVCSGFHRIPQLENCLRSNIKALKIHEWNSLLYSSTHTHSSPVDVVQLVHRVDSQHHLGQVELGHLLGQPILKLAEQRQQVAAHIVVHDQVLEPPEAGETAKKVVLFSNTSMSFQRMETTGGWGGGGPTQASNRWQGGQRCMVYFLKFCRKCCDRTSGHLNPEPRQRRAPSSQSKPGKARWAPVIKLQNRSVGLLGKCLLWLCPTLLPRFL